MCDTEFNSGEPLGYFITWTCYGTWLPGDKRSWQRKDVGERQVPNELFEEMAAATMKETAFNLGQRDREIVEATIIRHCDIRKWDLHTVDARSNHVHVVVTAPGYKPEVARDQFKAWCTRKLKAIHRGREKFWVEGGSRRYLNSEADLDNAVKNVNEAQDRKGLEPIRTRRASE